MKNDYCMNANGTALLYILKSFFQNLKFMTEKKNPVMIFVYKKSNTLCFEAYSTIILLCFTKTGNKCREKI